MMRCGFGAATHRTISFHPSGGSRRAAASAGFDPYQTLNASTKCSVELVIGGRTWVADSQRPGFSAGQCGGMSREDDVLWGTRRSPRKQKKPWFAMPPPTCMIEQRLSVHF
jgi:hypothetical protein